MSRNIGIKLADGTFYPILEEGQPKKRLLELTTVEDNQTTVMVDLYRSETGTMADAEYVDTLQISGLVPHPEGEPALNLMIQLDDNNVLSAEVTDVESGASSNTTVKLVNRPAEERAATPDFLLSEITDADSKNTSIPDEMGFADEAFPADFPESIPLDAFDDSLPDNSGQNEPTEFSPAETDFLPDFDTGSMTIPDFDDPGFDEAPLVNEELPEYIDDFPEEIEVNDALDDLLEGFPIAPETTDEDTAPADFDTPVPADDGTSATVAEFSEQEAADDNFSLPDFSDIVFDEDTPAETTDADTGSAGEDTAPADFDTPVPADDGTSATAAESSEQEAADDNFSLPDFSDIVFDEDTPAETTDADTGSAGEDTTPADFDTPVPADDGTSATVAESSEQEAADDNFSLPDFSDIVFDKDTPAETAHADYESFTQNPPDTDSSQLVEEAALPDFSNFELPDFDDPAVNNFDSASGLFTDQDFDDPVFQEQSTGNNNMQNFDFSGLYDDPTTDSYPSDEKKHRNIIPVVICVICALICLGALGIILWFLPSHIDIDISRRPIDSAITESEEPDISIPAVTQLPVQPQPKEDTIVISETPAVVPMEPPVAEPKPDPVRYKIKWGDTLWDLADSYYNNPWLYKKIAAENSISNPDYIISGTSIIIPPK